MHSSGPVAFSLAAVDYAGNTRQGTQPGARLEFAYNDRTDDEGVGHRAVHPPHHDEHDGPGRRRRGAVEEDELVGSLGCVEPAQLRGVARVPQLLEPDSFHDTPVPDVEAGYDTPLQHAASRASCSVRRPW